MNAVLSSAIRILYFIIAFGLLVFLHELGHYLMAKLFHIEVEEFGFGFPPRLVKLFQFQETVFTLNWIPFGAFVRPKGENDPTIAGGLGAANPWARLAVLFGGPLMNIITGIFLFSLIFTSIGAPDYTKVLVVAVNKGSPAETAGLKVNDLIVSINATPVDSTEKLSNIVHQNLGQEIQITLQRGQEQVVVHATPREKSQTPPNEGALGIQMTNPYHPVSWFGALPISVHAAYDQVHQLVMLPSMLMSGTITASEARPVGPVGIYGIFSTARQEDQKQAAENKQPEPLLGLNTLSVLAVVSVALGITNLLPIPALDGGRILFVLPEIIFRRRVPAEYENMIHLIGFTILILLMIYITTQDVILLNTAKP